MEDRLEQIFNELKTLHQKIDRVNDDVQFIKSIYTTPVPERIKNNEPTKEERSAARIAKLLRTPHKKG